MSLPEWPEGTSEDVLRAQNHLAYLQGHISRPAGIRAPQDITERKRRTLAVSLWLSVRGY